MRLKCQILMFLPLLRKQGDLQITNLIQKIPQSKFKTLKKENFPNEFRIVRMLVTYMYQINNSQVSF